MANGIKKNGDVIHQPVLVWHAAAHEYYKEQLYYLLLIVKPFENERFRSQIQELMRRYGVSQWCMYQVFGNFDIVLRVWLPPQVFRDFSQEFTAEVPKIQNLHSSLLFQTTRKLQCSGFFGFDNDDRIKLQKPLEELTPERILKVQLDHDQQVIELLREQGLLRTRDNTELLAESKMVKTFIAFSEPYAGLPNKTRAKIVSGIAAKLNDGKRGFSKITLLEGVGFCWLFAKVVVKQFSELGRFVDEIANEFGPSGVSTSSFILTRQEDAVEGDSISDEALREFQGSNRKVASIVPDLYKPRSVDLDAASRKDIERFVLDKMVPAMDKGQLDREDVAALRNFLEAIIADSRDEAFVAVFPRIIHTESALREPVVELAKKCPGNVGALIEELKKLDPKVDKSAGKLSLLDSLRAARWILAQLLPGDTFSSEELTESSMKEICDQRNIVAHGRDFQPRKDWAALANGMLKMFTIRRGVLTRYDKVRTEATDQKVA